MSAIECVLIVPQLVFWWTAFLVVYVWKGCCGIVHQLLRRAK